MPDDNDQNLPEGVQPADQAPPLPPANDQPPEDTKEQKAPTDLERDNAALSEGLGALGGGAPPPNPAQPPAAIPQKKVRVISNEQGDAGLSPEMAKQMGTGTNAQTFAFGMTGQGDGEHAAERVDLCSRGIGYPQGHPCSQGFVMVRPMTTKEEDILVTDRYQKQGTVLDMIMSRCILTPGVNTLDLISGDRLQILFYLRAISYGPEYKFTVTMPSTGTRQEVTANVSDLQIDTLPDDFEEPAMFQIDGFNYEVRLSRGHDERSIILARMQEKRKKGAQATEVGGSMSLKNLIVSVNGEDDTQAISNHVDTMNVRHAAKLRKAISDMSPGPNLRLDVLNDESGEMEEIAVPIGPEFFRADIESD